MIFIGVGSNIDAEKNIPKALKLLSNKCLIVKMSSLYLNEPFGYKKQDWFLNMVVSLETSLNPFELLEYLQSIEKKLERKRTIKNGLRTIDLDILLFDDWIIQSDRLTIPHLQIYERDFVRIPLGEINGY